MLTTRGAESLVAGARQFNDSFDVVAACSRALRKVGMLTSMCPVFSFHAISLSAHVFFKPAFRYHDTELRRLGKTSDTTGDQHTSSPAARSGTWCRPKGHNDDAWP